MTRSAEPYAEMRRPAVRFTGSDVSQPVAGFYRYRLHGGAVRGGVRLWYGPPHDPVTGEVLDRSWRWQAEMDGEPVAFDRVWPGCAGEPVSEDVYRQFVARRKWAEQHAPGSAYAKPGQRYDPLSTATPLPF